MTANNATENHHKKRLKSSRTEEQLSELLKNTTGVNGGKQTKPSGDTPIQKPPPLNSEEQEQNRVEEIRREELPQEAY